MYQQAGQCFINKDFAQSIQLLGHNPPADTKHWLLYLALCDRALADETTDKWNDQNIDRQKLKHTFVNGLIWSQLNRTWLDYVPQLLVIALLKLSIKYESNPEPIVKFMEIYISDTPEISEEIKILFIVEIIANLSHDFVYARELAKSLGANKEDLFTRIDAIELKLKEDELAKQVAKEQAELKAQLEAEQLKQQAEELAQSETEELPIEKANKLPVIPPRVNLNDVFKKWLHGVVRGQGVYNAVAIILIVYTILKNRSLKKSFTKSGKYLYEAVRSGILMALQVTYL